MSKYILIPKFILTADKDNNILENNYILVENDFIKKIDNVKNIPPDFDGEIINCNNLIASPGFVQTHIHLCQTLFRGYADDLQLLDWLRLRIFPFENSHTPESLKISAALGINELLLSGTTTLLDMGTLRHQSVIFDELKYSGIRAFAGKCMMDENDLYPDFCADTKDELNNTYELAKEFHSTNGGLIHYGFAPRFALSCSSELMVETKNMMADFKGSLFHTHASENKNECSEVKRKYHLDNIQYFDSLNLLNERTVLAHCIHLNDSEIAKLKENNVRISHCPSSNLKLGSGIADIPRYIKEGISVSLGADGAPCNNNLSIFNEMRLASLIQKPFYSPTAMDAGTVFKLATIDGAKALHIDDITGSLEEGKKADIVLLDLDKYDTAVNVDKSNVLGTIVYGASKSNISDVIVNGEWKVKAGESLIYDSLKLRNEGSIQFNNLLTSIN